MEHNAPGTRGERLLAEGKNPVHVKEAVGRSDPATTIGYARLSREHLRSLVTTLPAAPAPTPAPAGA